MEEKSRSPVLSILLAGSMLSPVIAQDKLVERYQTKLDSLNMAHQQLYENINREIQHMRYIDSLTISHIETLDSLSNDFMEDMSDLDQRMRYLDSLWTNPLPLDSLWFNFLNQISKLDFNPASLDSIIERARENARKNPIR